jgi:hypothetical protein
LTRGTIDCWFKMGSGASSVALIQSAYGSTATPLITVGVNASGQATGSVQDRSGAAKAAWAAGSMGVLAQGALVHLQMAWDASLFVVKTMVNGVSMPTTDFTTAALASWVPFQPTYLTTGIYTETAFDGEMILTQLGLGVVI